VKTLSATPTSPLTVGFVECNANTHKATGGGGTCGDGYLVESYPSNSNGMDQWVVKCDDGQGNQIYPSSIYIICAMPPSQTSESPSISIQVLVNGDDANIPPGPKIQKEDPVNWSYLVTNTGDVGLNNITVIDNRGVAVTCPKANLSPGESMT